MTDQTIYPHGNCAHEREGAERPHAGMYVTSHDAQLVYRVAAVLRDPDAAGSALVQLVPASWDEVSADPSWWTDSAPHTTPTT